MGLTEVYEKAKNSGVFEDIAGLTSAVKQMRAEARRRELLGQLANNYEQAQNTINTAYHPRQSLYSGGDHTQEATLPNQKGISDRSQNIANIQPAGITQANIQAPKDLNPPEFFNPPVDYGKAQNVTAMQRLKLMQEGLKMSADNPDVNVSPTVGQYDKMLQMNEQANTPAKSKYVTEDPTKDIYQENPISGQRELVKKGQPKDTQAVTNTETDNNGEPKIYSRGGKQFTKEVTQYPNGKTSVKFKALPNAPRGSGEKPFKPLTTTSATKLITDAEGGIEKIKSFKNSRLLKLGDIEKLYPDEYTAQGLGDSSAKELYVVKTSSKGKTNIEFYTPKELDKAKEDMKGSYSGKVDGLVAGLNLDEAVNAMHEDMKANGVDSKKALDRFLQHNSGLSSVEKKALRSYIDLYTQ